MIDNSPPPYPGNVVYVTPISGVAAAAHCPNYLHRQSIGLGATQIAIGCLCIIFNAVCFGIGSVFLDLTFIGYGIWCGVMFIISGTFGIAAGKTKSRCQIIAYMVLCIISACFSPALLICGIWGSVLNGSLLEDCKNGYTRYYYRSYYYRPSCGILIALTVLEAALAACGLIVAILFIWGSTLACKAKVCTCCYQDTYREQMMMAHINNSAPNNFQGLQGLQVANYSSNTMPYQHGMVVVSGHQPYLPNMDPTTEEEEMATADGAQVQYNSYSPCKY